jgi:hypothetical protein
MLISGSHLSLDGFLENFNIYCTLYLRLMTTDKSAVHSEAFSGGKQPNKRVASWTKRDLEDLLRSKRLHQFFPKIDGTRNLEKDLTHAFRIQQEKARIESLCEIPGIGPVLASVLLESMYPEMYGALNSRAWNALRLLSFNLPRKRVNCDGFAVHELLRYLEIIRKLAKEMGTTPEQMEKALYAYDKTVADKRWKRQFVLILRRYTTPVLSACAKGQFTDATPTSNSRTLSSPI